MSRDTIQAILDDAVSELNRQLPPESRLDAGDADAVLLGEGGTLDSLSLITLFVAVEERLEQRLGGSLSLVEQSAEEADAFHTVGALIDWITDHV